MEDPPGRRTTVSPPQHPQAALHAILATGCRLPVTAPPVDPPIPLRSPPAPAPALPAVGTARRPVSVGSRTPPASGSTDHSTRLASCPAAETPPDADWRCGRLSVASRAARVRPRARDQGGTAQQ